MIDVKDRVPSQVLENGAVRYEEFDADGNSLGYKYIKRADEPTEVGTPVNKALFDSIKSGNDLVQKYNFPRILKNDNNYNYFELDNAITQYDIGMRVFIEFKNTYFNKFTESIIPVLTNASTPVNGFYYTFQQQSTSAKDIQNIYDKDDSTFGKMYKDGTSLFFPSGIKNFKVKVKTPEKGNTQTNCTIYLYGRQKGTTSYNSLGSITYTDNVAMIRYFEINDNVLYDSLKISMNSSGSGGITVNTFSVYTFDVIEGDIENYNSTLSTYLNINQLGNKLINGVLTENKKYLLVYDGTVFNATEVV